MWFSVAMRRICAILLLCGALLVGCDTQSRPEPGEVERRWKGLSEEYRMSACVHAWPSPDYREMLHVLMDAGYDQQEAAAMLPYAVEDCT